jgi:hypothetical protein
MRNGGSHMSQKKVSDETLFLALEAGASWPTPIGDLKATQSNFQAAVQEQGETSEHFVGRALDVWRRLLDTSEPPFRFILGTRPNPDERAVAARERLARGAFASRGQLGPRELILWSGTTANSEEQTRLFALAGTLLECHGSAERSVRVMFGDPTRLLFKAGRCPTEAARLSRRAGSEKSRDLGFI